MSLRRILWEVRRETSPISAQSSADTDVLVVAAANGGNKQHQVNCFTATLHTVTGSVTLGLIRLWRKGRDPCQYSRYRREACSSLAHPGSVLDASPLNGMSSRGSSVAGSSAVPYSPCLCNSDILRFSSCFP